MDWLFLGVAALVVWALCGAVMAFGRRIWSIETTVLVHLGAAPIFSFAASAIHQSVYPDFNPLVRAAITIGVVIALDLFVVAPFMERSYAMFRSVLGTWIPFALIFLASWAAGGLFYAPAAITAAMPLK
jgi:hypothetical protein